MTTHRPLMAALLTLKHDQGPRGPIYWNYGGLPLVASAMALAMAGRAYEQNIKPMLLLVTFVMVRVERFARGLAAIITRLWSFQLPLVKGLRNCSARGLAVWMAKLRNALTGHYPHYGYVQR